MTSATSERARQALTLMESLQIRFVQALEAWGGAPFRETRWKRDNGRHGGGVRYGMGDSARLGRASVNVSQVHYEDEPNRNLASASALSTIVHPAHPHAPSVHIHGSWTELKDGAGYWRIMADLNPSIPNPLQTIRFTEGLQRAAPGVFSEAMQQGDRYFFIPALERHRGAAHFYLESFNSGDFAADHALAQRVGEAAVDGYMELLEAAYPPASEADRALQLAYHTLYLFQVLTLDRGTTAGLLVHNQNDIGILGSLPPRIDKNLLASWRPRMAEPQDQLLDDILNVLPDTGICPVDDKLKQQLADVVRTHYRNHPEAIGLQASGNGAPPTVENHRSGRG